jgi:hypothetical protein
MSAQDEVDAAVAEVLGEAVGHLRNATEMLLAAEDPSGTSLLLGVESLELQDMLGEIWPAYIEDDRTAAESLAKAESLLAQVIDDVPLAVSVRLRSLRRQVDDGQH